MTVRNAYATLAEFKAYWQGRGGTTSTDTGDDVVIEQLLESASRYLEGKTARWFYPRIETRNYSIPGNREHFSRELYFDADVLAILTFLNGDGTSIAATNYNLLPKNETPKYMLAVKQNSTLVWELDSDGEHEHVLALTAIWGHHNRYSLEGWTSAGTLGAAITDTTTLAFTMTAGHSVVVDKIYRIDNELYIVSGVSSNTITPLKRGDNGSTAAAHANGTTVYEWQFMDDARNAVLEIANTAYKRRFGQSLSNSETITAGGIVLSPRDIPALAAEFITTYRRYL